MLRPVLTALLLAATAVPLAAQPARNVNPQIDFAGFRRLATEVEPYRQTRLVNWVEFDRLRGQRDVLILDARSEAAFRRGHIRGAVNLPFTDFTAESLARVIGRNPDRQILIYCNNNFSNNRAPVPMKSVQLALNIQTFINLVGYGYANVWELGDVVDFDNPAVGWVKG